MSDEVEPVDGNDDDVVPITLSRRSVDALVSKWKHIVVSVLAGGGIFASYVGTDSLLAALAAVVPPDPKEVECCVSVPGVLDRCKTIEKPPGAVATETPTCCDVVKHIALSCTEWRSDDEI